MNEQDKQVAIETPTEEVKEVVEEKVKDDRPTVDITMEPKSVYDTREVADKLRMGMPLLSASLDVLHDLLENVPEARDRIRSERDLLDELDRRDEYISLGRDDSDYWARVIVQSMICNNETGEHSFERKGAQWKQSLTHNGREIRAGQAMSRHSKGNVKADIAYLKRRTGQGIEINVPLPHSGLFLRIATPSSSDYADFQYRMSEEKLNFAMTNKGFAMSSMGYRQHDIITDFALSCVTHANVQWRTPTQLKERINILDRNILHWALASVIHPSGVDFAIPCLNYGVEKENDDDEGQITICNHVEEAKVNLRRMFFFDSGVFTNKQLDMLSQGFKIKTDADLATYREEGIFCKPKLVWLSDDVGVVIEPGTLYEYADYSSLWLKELVDLSATSLNEPPTNGNRQERMVTYSESMRAIQYRHWVKAIHVRSEEPDEEDIVYTDGDTIQNILEHIISGELTENFVQAIVEYIRDNKVALVAIPEYKCPVCGTSIAEDEDRKHKNLVEIEVSTYFFMFVALKLQSLGPGI